MAASLRRMRNIYHKSCSLNVHSIKDAKISWTVYRSYIPSLHNRSCSHNLNRLLRTQYSHGHLNKCCNVLAVRCKSSSSETHYGDTLQEGYLAPPTSLETPLDMDTAVSTGLNSLGEPTLASLGLVKPTPPGFIQTMLEIAHVDLGIPWWSSIVLGVVMIRCCLLPVQVITQKAQINMQNNMPTIQRLQQRMMDARKADNSEEFKRVAKEVDSFKLRNKISTFDMFMAPIVQIPVFLSVFWGLRAMAELPVESLKTGGILWFTNLTIPDPYFALPLLTSATLLLTIEAGALINSGTKTQKERYTKMFIQGMCVCILPIISQFPTALLCYWFASNIFTLAQVIFLQIPSVRKLFNMPERIVHTDMEKPLPQHTDSFRDGFKKEISNGKLMQEMEERERFMATIDSDSTRKDKQKKGFKEQSEEKDILEKRERRNS